MRCCDCSGNCESTTTIPFLDNRKAIVPPFSVETPTSFLSIFIFQGSANIVEKIFCCARVNAPNVSADERRKFRRFINNSLKVPKVSRFPEVSEVPKVPAFWFYVQQRF